MTNDRNTTTVLGVEIGTDSGWDEQDPPDFIVYDFEPNPTYEGKIPRGDLLILYSKGLLQIVDEEGQPRESVDMLSIIRR